MERAILRLGGVGGEETRLTGWLEGQAGVGVRRGGGGRGRVGLPEQGVEVGAGAIEDSQDQASLQVSPPQFVLNMGLFNNPAWALQDHK